jgi:hypothetical protein
MFDNEPHSTLEFEFGGGFQLSAPINSQASERIIACSKFKMLLGLWL